MLELKPCPHCGGTDLQIVETDMTCCIRCCTKGCWLEGPTKEWKTSAIEAWNALPRPLRWTKESPTEPGEYWNRSKKYKTKSVVQVFEQFGKLYVFYPGSEVEEELSPDDEWAGPIQEPVE